VEPQLFQYVLVYQKVGPMIYLGHLDFQQFWERQLRRFSIPIKFSEGFHPKMKLNFIQPLSLGMEGHHEYLHITCTEAVDWVSLLDAFNESLPTGLIVKKISRTYRTSKWFSKHRYSADYLVEMSEGFDLGDITSVSGILSYTQKHNTSIIKLQNDVNKQIKVKDIFSEDMNVDIIKLIRERLTYTIGK
jgi:radical SAM-linked protein